MELVLGFQKKKIQFSNNFFIEIESHHQVGICEKCRFTKVSILGLGWIRTKIVTYNQRVCRWGRSQMMTIFGII